MQHSLPRCRREVAAGPWVLGEGDREPKVENIGVTDAIVDYLIRSGWTSQSIESVRAELNRWRRQLERRGITAVPTLPVVDPNSPAEARAHNELNLLMLQAAKGPASPLEHHLRNVNGTRPYKA